MAQGDCTQGYSAQGYSTQGYWLASTPYAPPRPASCMHASQHPLPPPRPASSHLAGMHLASMQPLKPQLW